MLFAIKADGAAVKFEPKNEKIKIFNVGTNQYEEVDVVRKSEEEWKQILTPQQFKVTRKAGTERAFANAYFDNKAQGIYKCIGCGADLFSWEAKYNSRTGWPSFWKPVAQENIGYTVDNSWGMKRTEVHCPRCGAHLGHIFDDGPPPTGKRFCINSASLRFSENAAFVQEPEKKLKTATFAGGCFWCMQPAFDKLKGVQLTVVGYTGGDERDPTYEEVASGQTGHAEAVAITYDPSEVTYTELLDIFWKNIDPTALNQQFADVGIQYRTAIFYHDQEQKRLAEESKKDLGQSGKYQKPIVTEITPASKFYKAEDYHQDYYKKAPLRYKSYKYGSGRGPYLKKMWGEN